LRYCNYCTERKRNYFILKGYICQEIDRPIGMLACAGEGISQSLISITIHHAWRALCIRVCIVFAWMSKEAREHGALRPLSREREHEICFSSPRVRGSNFVVVPRRSLPRPVHTKCPFSGTSDRKDTPVGFNGSIEGESWELWNRVSSLIFF